MLSEDSTNMQRVNADQWIVLESKFYDVYLI